jgi:hypothetical protein
MRRPARRLSKSRHDQAATPKDRRVASEISAITIQRFRDRAAAPDAAIDAALAGSHRSREAADRPNSMGSPRAHRCIGDST